MPSYTKQPNLPGGTEASPPCPEGDPRVPSAARSDWNPENVHSLRLGSRGNCSKLITRVLVPNAPRAVSGGATESQRARRPPKPTPRAGRCAAGSSSRLLASVGTRRERGAGRRPGERGAGHRARDAGRRAWAQGAGCGVWTRGAGRGVWTRAQGTRCRAWAQGGLSRLWDPAFRTLTSSCHWESLHRIFSFLTSYTKMLYIL